MISLNNKEIYSKVMKHNLLLSESTIWLPRMRVLLFTTMKSEVDKLFFNKTNVFETVDNL